MTLRNRLAFAANRDVSRETCEKIERYTELLLAENQRQNLISKSSEEDVVERHIIDSAQLLRHAPTDASSWVDIGSGPGLPGLVIACLTDAKIHLVEPRPLRVEFLQSAKKALNLGDRVEITLGKAKLLQGPFNVITGRAVANLTSFLSLSHHLSTEKSRWVLPKGRKAQSELEEAKKVWHGEFSLEPSLTDDEASIVIASAVKRRGAS